VETRIPFEYSHDRQEKRKAGVELWRIPWSFRMKFHLIFLLKNLNTHDVRECNEFSNKPGERHKKDVGSEFNKAKDKRTSTQ